jgi:hypothetical protein
MRKASRPRKVQVRAMFGRGLLAVVSSVTLAIAGCGGGGGGGDAAADPPTPTQTVPPIPVPGPLKVACSNVAQDFGRVVPGDDIQDYW